MNRRGHLSSKVPNVKLRPASSAVSRKTREASPLNAMDQEMLDRAWANADDEEASSAALRSTRKPWEQVVITFTGIDDKPRLAELAKQLGATVESALTRDVTHVVAMGFGSPKYLYAVEHRLPVMLPAWIEDTHAQWVGAEEVGVLESMAGHRLLAFSGLIISVTGVEELERRMQIIKYITLNGGKYLKDLDRSVTHLVTVQPTNIRAPSAKVKWAVKQVSEADALRRAGKRTDKEDVKIVYEDWLWDCVGYEGRWKEDWYDARKVRRASRIKYEEVISGEAKEKMLQAVAVDQAVKEEPAVLKKRKRDAMENLVGDIISTATAGGTGSGGRDIKPTRTELSEAMDTEMEGGARPRRTTDTSGSDRKPSILHSSRTTSFAGPSRLARDAPIEAASTSSFPASIPRHPTAAALSPASAADQGDDLYPQPIFRGMRFTPIMSDDPTTLEAALRAHAGEVIPETAWREGEKTDYIIVRFRPSTGDAGSRPDMEDIPEEHRPPIVTECWIEGCCYEQRVLPLDQHIVFRPLSGRFPIPGAEDLSVHLSGFSSEISVYLRRLTKALGLTVSEKLNRQTTHLVCGTPAGQKYNKALEWRVSVVKDSWLIAMGQSAKLEPDNDHRHTDHSSHQPVGGSSTAAGRMGGLALASRTATMSGGNGTALERTDTDTALGVENVRIRSDTDSASKPRESSGVNGMQEIPESSSSSMSPLRKIKLTPTHIDQMVVDEPAVAKPSSLPLSPPTVETERMLNKADLQAGLAAGAGRRNHSEPESMSQARAKAAQGAPAGSERDSLESKLSRTASAPASSDTPRHKSMLVADPRSTSLATLGRPEMSEMLKLLAQPGATGIASETASAGTTPPGSRAFKPLRRPRLSGASAGAGGSGASKLRTSLAYASPPLAAHGGAGEGYDTTTGDTTADTTLRFSNSPPPTDGDNNMGMHDRSVLDPDHQGFDESVRVNYVDPVADKERRRLLEAMRKGAIMGLKGGSESSPARKRRV